MIVCKGKYYRGLKKGSWYFYFTNKKKQDYYEEVYFEIDSNLVLNYLNANSNEFRWFTKKNIQEEKTAFNKNSTMTPTELRTFAIFGDNLVEYEEVEKYYKQYYTDGNKIKQTGRIEYGTDIYNLPLVEYDTDLKLYSKDEKIIFSIYDYKRFAYKYYKTGELKEKIEITNSNEFPGSIVKTFLENPLDTNNYNEIKSGNFQYYYKNGILKSSGYYDTFYGKNGKWNYYYDDGQLQQTGEYGDFGRIGEWKEYHPNGALKNS